MRSYAFLILGAALLAGCVTGGQGRVGPANIELVRIPAGAFEMGSPQQEGGREADERPHRVTISRPFYMGKHEVTREQWTAVMGSEPWAGKRLVLEGKDLPAIYVTWDDAQAFVSRLNAMEGSGRYRLPTEAEWEYAARGGSADAFPGEANKLGWYADNSGRQVIDAQAAWSDDHQTRLNALAANGARYYPVGSAAPNPFGLYDMHGNLWEWVADWYGEYPAGPVVDPRGPATGETRSVRGGSWSLPKHFARSASRDKDPPGHTAPALGFRVARDLD